MTREEFEIEYANRHMGYDPRRINAKVKSVSRLRQEDGYTDTHIDLCWKLQMIQSLKDKRLANGFIKRLRW